MLDSICNDLLVYVEKTVALRINLIMSDPSLVKVYQKYGGRVFRRSSVFHGLTKVLNENHIKGDTCLEIGSWNGITAVLLAQRFKKVISLDIVDNPIKYEIANYLGLDIDFQVTKSKKIIDSIDFDFAYLDGDHRDAKSDFDRVKRCGRVLFHEYWEIQPPVWRLVNSLQNVKKGGTCFALWVDRGQSS